MGLYTAMKARDDWNGRKENIPNNLYFILIISYPLSKYIHSLSPPETVAILEIDAGGDSANRTASIFANF
jgi:hypothetical protein